MMFVGSNNSDAFAHTQRVKADSGVGTTLSVLEQIHNDLSLRSRLLCCYDPAIFGRKLNGSNLSKGYSSRFNPVTDFVQATTGKQPVFLPFSSNRYVRLGAENNIEADITSLAMSSQGTHVIACKISALGGSRGYYLSAPPSTQAFSVQYIALSNQLTIGLGNGGFNVSLSPFVPASEFWIRAYYSTYPTYMVDVSNDGVNWTNVHNASRTQANYTVTKMGVGKGVAATAMEVGNVHDMYLVKGGSTYNLGLYNYNPASNSKQWVSDGLTYVLQSINTLANTAPTQVVTEPTAAHDGIDDKLQSGTFAVNSGKCTLYLVADWGMVQSGTRYFLDDVNGNLVVYTDGTNVYVGDGGNVFSIGAKPSKTALLTFVKDGASSFAQFNQSAGITGNGGALMPTSIVLGGNHTNDTNNSTLTRAKMYLVDGADDTTQRAHMQALINSWQINPLF